MMKLNLPIEWAEIITLDAFSQISTTGKKVKTAECNQTGKYPVIDQGQLAISGYIDDPSKLITIKNPIILFGDHTRAIKWINFDFVPGADGTKLLETRSFIEPRFAFYQLLALEIPDKGYSRHFKYLKEVVFRVPPLAEQKIITHKLDELLAQVDTLKARLDAIPAILKRFRQSVLAAAVSGRLTEEWRSATTISNEFRDVKFGEIIIEMRNGLSPKPNEIRAGNAILRISSVRSFSVDQSDIRYLVVSDNDRKKYSLKIDDLLFTRYNGSAEFVGVCGKINALQHGTLLYPDKLIRVRVNLGIALPAYVEIFSASHLAKNYIGSLIKSTSGQKGISGGDLKQMPVALPSLDEQTEIVRRVEQLFAYADQVEQQVKNAQGRVNQLTQSILAKAFRGELTEQWRQDNPELISGDNSAAALLERIKAERAAATTTKKKAPARKAKA